jgi:5-methylcytosine-specific restriction protein B
MSDFQQQYALWDEFLSVWPVSRLASMTIDQYTKAGSTDTFTYWIESGLDEMGSIWGGSAFKFGVYSRKDTEKKASGNRHSYSDSHGWYSSLGTTAGEAFEKVRAQVVQVVDLAAKGDLVAIDAFEHLGEAFKWKIAFHYQDRQKPVIVNIFKREWLAAYVGGTAKSGMAILQKAAMTKRPADLGILEFGRKVLELTGKKDTGMAGTSADMNALDNDAVPSFGPALNKIVASKPIAACTNRIYYGPPGTGKTYALTQLLKSGYEQQAASFSAEEWRKQIISEKIAILTWWEGLAAALFDMGGEAKVPDLAKHDFIQAIAAAKGRSNGISQTLWGTLQNHTVLESNTVNLKMRLSPAIFDKAANSVWRFAGDWQGACSDIIALVAQLKQGHKDSGIVQRYSFVTFHQSYGYEEFVEGLRPVLSGDADAGEVAYEIRAGVFKDLCRRARQVPDQRWAMVIDEINRGNISKIFGELITLIEADKRDPLDGNSPSTEVTLAYSGEKFSVPANVDIIGTMNTADRSLALLDTALRRRFDFVALMPDTRSEKVPTEPFSAPLAGLVVKTDAGSIDLRQMLERINERIEALYDRDHCIGHAYLTGLAEVTGDQARFEALTSIFRNRILPLLEEYFFEDWHKIRLVLADNQKSHTSAQFILEQINHEQDLNALFGSDNGLDSYSTRRRYSVQESAFAQPAAYIGIYQSQS